LHKTATTGLHELVFCVHPKIRYLPNDSFGASPECLLLGELMFRATRSPYSQIMLRPRVEDAHAAPIAGTCASRPRCLAFWHARTGAYGTSSFFVVERGGSLANRACLPPYARLERGGAHDYFTRLQIDSVQ
jgi:hypothetical protein